MVNDGHATFEKLDLASFDSVNKFLDHQLLVQQKVNVWILNAGRISPNFERTNDGVESTLQVNFLSHQFLMDQLLRKNKKEPPLATEHFARDASYSIPGYCAMICGDSFCLQRNDDCRLVQKKLTERFHRCQMECTAKCGWDGIDISLRPLTSRHTSC